MNKSEKLIEELVELGQKIKEIQLKLTPGILRSELTFTQLWAIYVINKKGETNLKDFARELDIAQSTASSLIDRLVKLKTVNRIIPSEDRRKTLISLTSKGKKFLDDHIEQSKNLYRKLLSRMTLEERKDYLTVMKRYYEISLELLKEMNEE